MTKLRQSTHLLIGPQRKSPEKVATVFQYERRSVNTRSGYGLHIGEYAYKKNLRCRKGMAADFENILNLVPAKLAAVATTDKIIVEKSTLPVRNR
jgi:hypothetical protein